MSIAMRRGRIVKDHRGTVAIEVAFVLPLILLFFFSTIDVALWAVADAQLRHGIQSASRGLRVGTFQGAADRDLFRARLCEASGRTGADCERVIIDVRAVDGFSAISWPAPIFDENGKPTNYGFTPASPRRIMAVQARAPHRFLMPGLASIFPGEGLGNEATLVQTTVLVTEPF